MNAPTDTEARTAAFVASALATEGAELEACGPGAFFALLPDGLAASLALPDHVTLRFAGSAGSDEAVCPLEGAVVQALVDRAAERGRCAGVRLASRCAPAARRLDETLRRTTLRNATLAGAGVTTATATTLVLEFLYRARAEERAEGTVAVALPLEGGPASLALAEAFLAATAHADAIPEAVSLPDQAISGVVRAAVPVVEAEVRRRLEPFLAAQTRRMAVERQRVAEYHDRLEREVRRARGRVTPEALADKRAAVARARAERLSQVAQRHSVETTVTLDGALVVRHEAVLAALTLRRRAREVPVVVRWSPFLADPFGPACAGCERPSLSLHVCDEAGHVTCPECSARCRSCARIHCRACLPSGCAADPAAAPRRRG